MKDETRTIASGSASSQLKTNENAPVKKKTMSVPEMRKLLGLKKTESYWLVHRGFFKTEVIGGKMRVDLESFEKWYRSQVKHKKITGEVPGADLTSYSFQDVANLLSTHTANIYAIWKKENLKTITVDYVKRIPIEVFEKWYERQIMYQKVGQLPCLGELETDFIPLQKAADLLEITKEKLSVITRSSRYKTVFEIRVYENKKWISKRSFQLFLDAQSVYQVTKKTEERVEEQKASSIKAKEFVSRAEAAALAGVTTATITKWMQLGEFSCVGAGKILRIQRKDFLHWLEKRQEGTV